MDDRRAVSGRLSRRGLALAAAILLLAAVAIRRTRHHQQLLPSAAGWQRGAVLWSRTEPTILSRSVAAPTTGSQVWSPDSRYLLSQVVPDRLEVIDLPERRAIAPLMAPGSVWAISAVASCNRVAAIVGGDRFCVWDLPTGQQVATVRAPGQFCATALSPDGSRLAGFDLEGDLLLWSLPDGRRLAHITWPWSLYAWGFSPDGRRFAVSSEGGATWLFDSSDGRLIRRMVANPQDLMTGGAGVSSRLGTVRFSPDGRFVAAGGLESAVWDTVTGHRVVATGPGWGRDVEPSPSWRYVAEGGVVVQLPSCTSLGGGIDWSEVRLLAFSPTERCAVCVGTFEPDPGRGRLGTLWNALRRWLLRPPTGRSFTGVRVRSLPDWRVVAEAPLPLPPAANGNDEWAQLSPDAAHLAVQTGPSEIQVCRLPKAKVECVLSLASPIRSFDFAPDSRTLAVTLADQSLQLWGPQ